MKDKSQQPPNPANPAARYNGQPVASVAQPGGGGTTGDFYNPVPGQTSYYGNPNPGTPYPGNSAQSSVNPLARNPGAAQDPTYSTKPLQQMSPGDNSAPQPGSDVNQLARGAPPDPGLASNYGALRNSMGADPSMYSQLGAAASAGANPAARSSSPTSDGGPGVPTFTQSQNQLPSGMTPQQAQAAGWVYDSGFGGWSAPNGGSGFASNSNINPAARGAGGPNIPGVAPGQSSSNPFASYGVGQQAQTNAQGQPLDVQGRPIDWAGYGANDPFTSGPGSVGMNHPQAAPATPQPGGAPNTISGLTNLNQAQPAPQAQPGATTSAGNGLSIRNMTSNAPTSGTAYGDVSRGVNTSNVPGLVGGDALSGQMKTAQDAAYRNATGYLDPQFQNQQNDLESKLANQGIPQNSQAWNRAMDDFQRNKQFAYQQAQSNAVTQGNTAQSQLFNQGLMANSNQFGQNQQSAQMMNQVQQQLANQGFSQQQIDNLLSQNNFQNSMTMRNQDINELMLQQQNPLNMANALTNGQQVNQPNFTNTPGSNVGGTDIASIIQSALGQQNNTYNAQTGAANSSNAGMASIIAALISDRRFKKNVRQIGMHEVGVPLYAFDYLWDEPGIGVMADELEQVLPHAVFNVGGIKAVNYAAFSKVA